jgi:hypothetical protein
VCVVLCTLSILMGLYLVFLLKDFQIMKFMLFLYIEMLRNCCLLKKGGMLQLRIECIFIRFLLSML